MIDEIHDAVDAYKNTHGRGVALQVTMSDSVYQECLADSYNKVVSAMNINLDEHPPKSIFGYPLKVDESMNDGEFKIEKPRIYF